MPFGLGLVFLLRSSYVAKLLRVFFGPLLLGIRFTCW